MRAIVARGVAQLQNAADIIRGLAPDKPWRITLAPYRSKRSPEQNARLWALYREICSGTGNTEQEVHDALKKKFLPPKFVEIGDESIPIIPDSRDLDVMEFADFMTKVEMFAAQELGVVIGG